MRLKSDQSSFLFNHNWLVSMNCFCYRTGWTESWVNTEYLTHNTVYHN